MKGRPGWKKCTVCLDWKRLAIVNFPRRGEHGRRHEWRPECRACSNAAQVRKAREAREAKAARIIEAANPTQPKKPTKICGLCGSMPWRVEGVRCAWCRLLCKVEPRPELMLRRHFERAV